MTRRIVAVLTVAVLLLGGLLAVGGVSVGLGPQAVAILNDGQLVIGQPFIVDDQGLSLLTERGMRNLPRARISSLSFLTSTTLVLRSEGVFTGKNMLKGKIFYVGGLMDGRLAGTFQEKISPDPADPGSGRLIVRTRHSFNDGSTLEDWAICNCGGDRPVRGILRHQLAGVITSGSGLFAEAQGTMSILVNIDIARKPATTLSYFVFHFRRPIGL